MQHEIRKKKDTAAQHKCGVCSAVFPSLVSRNQHLLTHGSLEVTRDIVVCKLCSKHCDKHTYLTVHLLSHPLIYFCSVCAAVFPSSVRLVSHLDTHQSAALSSTDLFWQSIALSVFLPKSNNSDVNWLSGATEIISGEQMNSGQNSSLDDVLQDILASFANTSLEYSKLVEHREPSCTEPNDLDACASSFSVACIDQTVCFTMGYKPMSQDIFNRLRQTFGCIECGYCGQLFLVQSDLDSHVNIHTGLFYCFCSSFLTFTSRQCFDIVGWATGMASGL